MELSLDKETMKGIIHITKVVLQDYFFYDIDSIVRFYDYFIEIVAKEWLFLETQLDAKFELAMASNLSAKKYFTSHFIGFHVEKALVECFFFSENEVNHFKSLTSKYIGEQQDAE